LWSLLTIGLLISSRFLIYSLLKQIRFNGLNLKKVAIVGDGNLPNNLIKQTNEKFDSGFKVIKTLDFDEHEEISDLANLDLNEIWITYDLNHGEKVHIALDALTNSPAKIRIAPDLYTYRLINHSITDILGFPMFDVTSNRLVGFNAFLKDFLDKTISFIALFFLSPLMGFIALGVKLSSPGPIFYKQERVSMNGKIFKILKFRSMPVDVENEKITWGKADQKVKHWFGSFLRKSNFDELPQLINILKGDMSIVGPRPERPIFVNEFKHKIPNYMKKHLVKGGMTGWAQVHGLRGDTDLNERIEYDLFYIENWSFWLDLKIILLTLFIPFGLKSNAN
jgi:putative colanic acid biosynthesis UDP-glucose lipid carrier transferase